MEKNKRYKKKINLSYFFIGVLLISFNSGYSRIVQDNLNVEKIVEDLRTGRKDHEDFWIRMGDKYVYIRYFAVRNEKEEYLGVMEVTQDIKPIQEISGEKRLLS